MAHLAEGPQQEHSETELSLPSSKLPFSSPVLAGSVLYEQETKWSQTYLSLKTFQLKLSPRCAIHLGVCQVECPVWKIMAFAVQEIRKPYPCLLIS